MSQQFTLDLSDKDRVSKDAWIIVPDSEIPHFPENNLSSLDLFQNILQRFLTDKGKIDDRFINMSPVMTILWLKYYLIDANIPYWMRTVKFGIKRGPGHPFYEHHLLSGEWQKIYH